MSSKTDPVFFSLGPRPGPGWSVLADAVPLYRKGAGFWLWFVFNGLFPGFCLKSWPLTPRQGLIACPGPIWGVIYSFLGLVRALLAEFLVLSLRHGLPGPCGPFLVSIGSVSRWPCPVFQKPQGLCSVLLTAWFRAPYVLCSVLLTAWFQNSHVVCSVFATALVCAW